MTEPVIDIRDRIEKMRNQMTVPASKTTSAEIKVENKKEDDLHKSKGRKIFKKRKFRKKFYKKKTK